MVAEKYHSILKEIVVELSHESIRTVLFSYETHMLVRNDDIKNNSRRKSKCVPTNAF